MSPAGQRPDASGDPTRQPAAPGPDAQDPANGPEPKGPTRGDSPDAAASDDAGPGPSPQELRPSLLAALDVSLKVLGVVTVFTLPVVILALLRGEAVTAAAIFLTIEALQFYPAILLAFLPAVQLAFTRYIVEEDGLRIRVQILSKSDRRVPWEKVTALRQRRSLVDAILRIERLDVIAYGERGTTFKLVGLRDAAPLRDLIARQMRASASVEALQRGD